MAVALAAKIRAAAATRSRPSAHPRALSSPQRAHVRHEPRLALSSLAAWELRYDSADRHRDGACELERGLQFAFHEPDDERAAQVEDEAPFASGGIKWPSGQAATGSCSALRLKIESAQSSHTASCRCGGASSS